MPTPRQFRIAPADWMCTSAVAATDCYFCHDAPCITACPTDIDIPLCSSGRSPPAHRMLRPRPSEPKHVMGGSCASRLSTENNLCNRLASAKRPGASRSRSASFNASHGPSAAQGVASVFKRVQHELKWVAVWSVRRAFLCAPCGDDGHDVNTFFDARPQAPAGLNEIRESPTYKEHRDGRSRSRGSTLAAPSAGSTLPE